MPLNLAKSLVIKDGVLIQELSSESVLLDVDSEQYFGLDDVGTQMLMTLKQSPSIQVAFDRLLTQYEVDPEQLKQDLLSFIEQLVQHDLVELTEA